MLCFVSFKVDYSVILLVKLRYSPVIKKNGSLVYLAGKSNRGETGEKINGVHMKHP
jgi:hypothetical protein